ncbi:hypothetical protein [Neosynechococcus sphagnicola]|uniref:hypothetical protein n=1 Tax=Neosynechococcus sphagnicola TaxID=1501145 RepID=UPI00069081C6|nr:hypothetical protein [Neosynechococcus sphagnicola]
MADLFPSGHILSSPGCHFSYRVVGSCCRLFDREQLPWPCCRLEWGGKEPSWRRVGRRFILDMATRDHPSYSVEILGCGSTGQPLILTLYSVELSPAEKSWWFGKPSPGLRGDPSSEQRMPTQTDPPRSTPMGAIR